MRKSKSEKIREKRLNNFIFHNCEPIKILKNPKKSYLFIYSL